MKEAMTNFDCKDIKAMLSGLVDDEVDAQTRHQAERHLADCWACRDLLSEAEGLNEMVALETQRSLWPVGLPSGFEASVLDRTVGARSFAQVGRRWVSWTGWVAAAASFLLAASIWMLDGRPMPLNWARDRAPVAQADLSLPGSPPDSRLSQKSWTYDGPFSPDDLSRVALVSFPVDDQDSPAADSQADSQLAVHYPAVVEIAPIVSLISLDDADTLYAASTVLDMLGQADLESFADVDRIRRIAEYDNLLDRLAAARGRLSAADRPVVLAAESILLRIVQGPLNLDDVRVLRETVTAMDLPAQVQTISNRWTRAASL